MGKTGLFTETAGLDEGIQCATNSFIDSPFPPDANEHVAVKESASVGTAVLFRPVDLPQQRIYLFPGSILFF